MPNYTEPDPLEPRRIPNWEDAKRVEKSIRKRVDRVARQMDRQLTVDPRIWQRVIGPVRLPSQADAD